MSGAQVFARKVRRLVLNRQGTEAQIFLLTPGEGFLYLRSDGFAHFAQGLGAEEVVGFSLGKGRVELRFQDGSALTLRYRLGRWVKVLHFS
ncbi:MAG: hypothetical protein ABWJ63_10015 [Thermus sp.]|uniref:Uncharacterized protein n=1 Tax=Thermus brevis TaxID=2862456 RepID=A0ABS7A0T8_9DEIN|nr:hypothetical protein [Thermus brevis]MBW6395700.1 hypothetical protein [Thermus brevis]